MYRTSVVLEFVAYSAICFLGNDIMHLSVFMTDVQYFDVMSYSARRISPYVSSICGSGGTPPWVCCLDRVARRNSVMFSSVPIFAFVCSVSLFSEEVYVSVRVE